MSMRLNVIEIIWHDLGQYLACYGENSASTPYLDQFANEGTLMQNMFCSAPQCSPSRGSIMTGCYPHSNGLMGLAHVGWTYSKGQRTIPHILKEYGYKSYLLGFEHEAPRISDDYLKNQLGYDFILPLKSYHSSKMTSAVCNFIENKLDKKTPFFMSIGFTDVHRPNRGEVTQKDIDNVILPPYIPDNEGTRRDMAKYEKMIQAADKSVGHILDTIKRANLEENTIIFFTTDHGSEFNRAKMTLYDPGLKVACIFKWKNFIKGNQRLEGMRSNIDILPTLFDLMGVALPEFVQGESFKWSLLGYEDKSREYIIGEKTHHAKYDPMRCIRTKQYKYIFNKIAYEPMQISEEHSIRMGLELANQLYGKERTEEELYDLIKDPNETNNLAYKDEYREIKNILSKKLFTILRETNDPLLNGDVPRRRIHKPLSLWITDRSTFKLKITNPERYREDKIEKLK